MKNFLGNKETENYTQFVWDMLLYFNRLDFNMSVKVHYFVLDIGLYSQKKITPDRGKLVPFLESAGQIYGNVCHLCIQQIKYSKKLIPFLTSQIKYTRKLL